MDGGLDRSAIKLPDEWANDPDRCASAGVPEAQRRALAKTEIALEEIDRIIAAGARFARVLADAGYGMGAAFRQGLSARGLTWAVGVLKTQNVYPPTVELRWPTAATGRPRRHPVPSEAPVAAETMLASADWRRISWRQGSKGPLAAEFAALRARPAEGASCATAGTCPGTRSGWWASIGPRASGSTTCPTYRPTPRLRSWRRRSRPPSPGSCPALPWRRIDRFAIDGSASKPTNS